MADLSAETQAIIDELNGKTAKNDFTPETKEILKRYVLPTTGAGAFDSEGNPVSNYIPTDGSTPQQPTGVGPRVYDAVTRSLQGPFGPPPLPQGTNRYGDAAYEGFIRKPLTLIDYASRPLQAVGTGATALAAGLGEASGLMDRSSADMFQRDTNLAGQSALILGGMSPAKATPSAVKAKSITVPLAEHEPAVVGGGYLSENGVAAPRPNFEAPAGRVFDVAEDGATSPVQPSQAVTVTTPPESTVGAAQVPSGYGPTMSAKEAAARQAASEGSQLEQTDSHRRVGGIDTAQYVPGTTRTLGSLDLGHAAEEAAFRDMYPTEFKNLDKANNDALVDHLERGIPDPIAIHNMTEAREAQRVKDITPMKENPKPVELAPVKKLIEDQLGEGAEDRGLVESTLNSVLKTLSDKDGNLRTDPNRIYNGARKNITDMLERAKADPKSNEATAQHHLVEIKNALDEQIAATNPTFRTYLDNYAKASAPIDEAQLLGELRKKVTNASGQLQLSRLDSVLNSIDKARNSSSGANKAMHLTEPTLQRLYDLRNHLQAEEARNDMARTVGSNTHMRILQGQKYLAPQPSPIKNALQNMAEAAFHGVANGLDPTSFGANALIRYTGDKLGRARAEKLAREAAERTAKQEAAQKSRLQQFLNPAIGPDGQPRIGHNGGPPIEGFNQPPEPKSGGAAATPSALVNDYTPTTDLARYHQATQTNALQGQAGIRAFHGSGADFNAFDNNRIGSGEGNQAFGMGHYSAEAERTAENYLSDADWKYGNTKAQTIYDRLYSPSMERGLDNEGWSKLNAQRGFWEKVVLGRSPHTIIDDAIINPENYGENEIAYINSLNPDKFKRKGGHMYELNINADPEHFLDWDKPLNEQSEHVKNAIANSPLADYEKTKLPGSQIAPTTVEGAKAMHGYGIKGIKYLDQQSRQSGEGTRNYVVFDPATIEIIRKYGLAGLIAGSAATGGKGSDQ